MRSVGIWFFLTCKRYLRKISFLLILLALPAAAFFIRRAEREEAQEIRIAVCVQREEEGEGVRRERMSGEETFGEETSEEALGEETSEEEALGEEIFGEVAFGEETSREETSGEEMSEEAISRETASLEKMLLDRLAGMGEEETNSIFRFYPCDSEEQLKAEVASGKAECGYVISPGIKQKLDRKEYKRSILVYSAPSTVLASLSTEVVFAALMELYGKDIFVNYISGQELVGEMAAAAGMDNRQLAVQAEEAYERWMGNGSTFRFQYRQPGVNEKEDGEEKLTAAVFPVRGFVAVYLFIAGLYSAVMLGLDEKKGLFLSLRYGEGRSCRGAVLAAPIFLVFLSGFAALASGGCLQGIGREAGAMAVYFGAVCLFSYAVKVLCRKPQAVCCLIPLFLVGSLVFTPVFVDIGQFFPEWEWIGKLFLPFYYLKGF